MFANHLGNFERSKIALLVACNVCVLNVSNKEVLQSAV